MTNLIFRTTAPGRAALVNAQHDGTLPVVVTHIGVTATAFTAAADGSDTALPGELKRLGTFGGAAVDDDIIHVAIQDESADAYSLRGFGLYLADGTLFGLYGQADAILEKSAQAAALLAADVKFADISAGDITFGGTGFTNPPATTQVQGVVELATNAEAATGSDTQRAVTPAAMKAATDERFGAAAPSAYVKGLLTAADAAAARTTLGIKSAALKNEGPGNGLDADSVDGKHATDFATAAQGLLAASAVQPAALAATLATAARWLLVADATTLTAGCYVVPNNTAAALTLTLPAAPVDGDTVEWRQGAASFAVHPVVFARNGKTIMGLAEDMTVDTDAAGGSLVWRQALNTWRVYATSTAGTV